MLSNKRIFLTGGAGFIGAQLVRRLADNNELFIFDNYRRDALTRSPFANQRNVKVTRGDVTDAAALDAAMKSAKPQVVVHMAAIAGIDTVIKSPTTTMRVTELGTMNALECASRIEGLERFVEFSTSEVFGSNAFRAEESALASIGAVGEARWSYAVGKLSGEHMAHAWNRECGLPTVTLRPFYVYG